MTAETSRQEFMVVWGQKGGNGKSTLFEDLLPTILTGEDENIEKTYHHSLNIKDMLTTTGSNADSVYNLAGKRYATMSEPKLEGKMKLDGEVLKRLTGDKHFSASAKYKNEITFTPRAKIAMLCNKLVQFDCDDGGQLRRVIVIEMNTPFLYPHEYALASEEEKAKGLVKLRDEAVIDRIKKNPSGLLKYFLEGAYDYYNDPKRAPPAELLASKAKAVGELDETTRWIKGYLVPCEKDCKCKAKVKLSEIKNYWKSDSSTLNLYGLSRTQGFNEKFIEKFKKLYPAHAHNINFHIDRSNEAYIKHCKIHMEDESDEE
jgi:phage/plasmid-associated DNA primase